MWCFVSALLEQNIPDPVNCKRINEAVNHHGKKIVPSRCW